MGNMCTGAHIDLLCTISTMIEKHLKYNFPEKNSDPFDANFDGNYFAFANAFTNLSDKLSDFSIDVLEKHIPMGYKTIIILSRLRLLSNGFEKARWEESINKVTNNSYFLTTDKTIQFFRKDWKSSIDTNVIYKPESNDASLNSSIWKNFQECLEYAKKVSEENKCEVIISKVLDSISWH